MSGRRLAACLIVFLAATAIFASPLDRQMRDLERIRGLSFLRDVKVVAIHRSDLPRYMRDQITKSLPYSFDEYMLTLEALRLIERDPGNLQQRFVDLLQQQVLAFYDPLTHTYYSLDEAPPAAAALPAGFSLNDAVAVHELMHAMQDQRFGLSEADRRSRNDWDESLALHAVLEGEASLVMMAELVAPLGRTLDDVVNNDLLMKGLSAASAMMRSSDPTSPRYFLDSLAFPYVSGMRFVAAAYKRGGWAAVSRIYDDPPRSTRDVLHPDEYFAGKRTGNELAAAGPSYPGLLSVEHLGEWHWGFLVGEENARGWKGDRVAIVQDRFCRPTVLAETSWESPERARAFRNAYDAFLRSQKIDAEVTAKGTTVVAAYGADDALVERFMNDRR